ncbi:FliH/SctL family protein [Thermoanaerobacterium thermosulfurigenes]|uniref:FliH/SctL family protein n=1 Tax=Thermoanaerobacterium thermosulfurigenes TaxID=33950 RepID=UPI003EF5CF2F
MYRILKNEDCVNSAPVTIEKPRLEKVNELTNNKLDMDDSFKYLEFKKRLEKISIIQNEIIKAAKDEAENLIKKAKEIAEEIKENAKRDGYKEGYERGYVDGLNKGLEDGKGQTYGLLAEAREIKEMIADEKRNLHKEIESDIVSTVIYCVKKIIDLNIEENKDLVINLVKKGLENYEASNVVTVRVSDEDYEFLTKNKDKLLKSLKFIDDVNIVRDISLDKYDCIVQTPSGMIDCGLKTQIESIREALKGVLNEQ